MFKNENFLGTILTSNTNLLFVFISSNKNVNSCHIVNDIFRLKIKGGPT